MANNEELVRLDGVVQVHEEESAFVERLRELVTRSTPGPWGLWKGGERVYADVPGEAEPEGGLIGRSRGQICETSNRDEDDEVMDEDDFSAGPMQAANGELISLTPMLAEKILKIWDRLHMPTETKPAVPGANL